MAKGSPGDSADGSGGVAIDVEGGQKKDVGQRFSWVRVTATRDAPTILECTKLELIELLDLSVRDLRHVDPRFSQSSGILSCGRAIVCFLEPIRCIITADEALFLNDPSPNTMDQVAVLHRDLVDGTDDAPFEFIALEFALKASCSFLDAQSFEKEAEAYPLLDELATKTSARKLELVRQLKSRLLAFIKRVEKVRDDIERLMNDDGSMAKCYLTEKKRSMEVKSLLDQEGLQVPVSTVLLPHGSRSNDNSDSPESNRCSTARLELMLEAAFLYVDYTFSKLASLKEYMDNSEDYVNFQLDILRNKLLKFELMLGSAAFAVAIFAVVPSVFGMNFEGIALYKAPHAFLETLGITGVCSLVILVFLLWYLRRRLSPL